MVFVWGEQSGRCVPTRCWIDTGTGLKEKLPGAKDKYGPEIPYPPAGQPAPGPNDKTPFYTQAMIHRDPSAPRKLTREQKRQRGLP